MAMEKQMRPMSKAKPKAKAKNIGYTPGAVSKPNRVARPKPKSEAAKQLGVLTQRNAPSRSAQKAAPTRQQVIAKSMKANPRAELDALRLATTRKNQAVKNASQAAIASVKKAKDAAAVQKEIQSMRNKLKGK